MNIQPLMACVMSGRRVQTRDMCLLPVDFTIRYGRRRSPLSICTRKAGFVT